MKRRLDYMENSKIKNVHALHFTSYPPGPPHALHFPLTQRDVSLLFSPTNAACSSKSTAEEFALSAGTVCGGAVKTGSGTTHTQAGTELYRPVQHFGWCCCRGRGCDCCQRKQRRGKTERSEELHVASWFDLTALSANVMLWPKMTATYTNGEMLFGISSVSEDSPIWPYKRDSEGVL